MVQQSFEPPHPATVYFADELRRVMATLQMRKVGTDEFQSITPYALHQMLQRQSPDTPISRTQLYRIVKGETAPKIDLVYELAAILGVSPKDFMPDQTVRGSAHKSPIVVPPSHFVDPDEEDLDERDENFL